MMPLYSQACVDLVKESEGLRLIRYFDVVNIPTIGYGHVVRDEDGPLMAVTEDEAEALLDHDLTAAWDGVRRCVSSTLTQGQVDALTDFVFNLGERNLAKSTLLKYVNARKFDLASEEFSRWNMAGGVALPGLTHRREQERRLFVS